MDFSKQAIIPKTYRGANGKKICIVLNNKLHMLKFPPVPVRKDSELKYSNSCFSEYIGCNIFNTLGIEAQNTILGKYNNKIVVACEDFEVNNYIFQDFASLKNTVLDSSESGYGTELNDVLFSIEEQNIIDSGLLKERFWNMFIIDSYIGNFDRHNGNWGFLANLQTNSVKLAPVFDCGSSLFSQASDGQMEKILNDKTAIEYRIYSIPRSALKENGVKINPYIFLKTTNNIDCIQAIKKIVPRIREKQNEIFTLVQNTPYISKIHKKFIETILSNRYEKILEPALKRVLKTEKKISLDISKPNGKGIER